jgi:hypothetical protein
LDDLTILHHHWKETPTVAVLFAPREGVRTPARGFGGEGGGPQRSGLQYPQPGAAISYYLAADPPGEYTLDILDAAGKVVRTFSSAGSATVEDTPPPDAAVSDDEGGFRTRGGPTRLSKGVGLHRFTWDLRYPGPWQNERRPEGPNGPVAVPGKYAVRLTVGSWTATEPLTIVEDPRITKTGVTTADLAEQFDHNMKVRELVTDVNKLVARVRAAQSRQKDNAALNTLASHLITPAIRYSKPELQTHLTYLYSLTTATDQKIGHDAVERFGELRKELDARVAELNKLLGAEK